MLLLVCVQLPLGYGGMSLQARDMLGQTLAAAGRAVLTDC